MLESIKPIKRYMPTTEFDDDPSYQYAVMIESKDGEYVKLEDVTKLVEAITKEVMNHG